MFLFRRAKRLTPSAVPTDKVVPVHYWDRYCTDAIMNFMLRFDRKLDAEKLRVSLATLLNRNDGWRKLGARVRKNAQGQLEYHIPSKYNEQRPAISYHHQTFNMGIMQHPLASRLPKAPNPPSLSSSPSSNLDTPQVMGRGDDFVTLMRRPSDPTSFEDYLYTDAPMLGLQIVTFNDATLVSLHSSHILFDAMGRKELLNAWSLTLQGRENEVVPLIESDPLEALKREGEASSGSPSDQYLHANKQLRLIQVVHLGIRQAVDKILNRRAVEETRIIRVPEAFVHKLRKGAVVDPETHLDEIDVHKATKSTFLSDGDVLCAWWARHIISSRIFNASKRRQTVAILNMMGLRRLLHDEGMLPRIRSALVANAMVAIPAFLSAKDLITRPLGHVAMTLRKAIQQLGSRPQVEALLTLQRTANDSKNGIPALFGDARMHMVVCTNWTKAGFFDVDFSSAIEDLHDQVQMPHNISGASTSHSTKELQQSNHKLVAKPSNVHMHIITSSTPAFMMSIFSILGKDPSGNYWILGILRKKYWAKIEKALREER